MKYEVTLHQSDHYRKTFKIIASNLDKANEEAQKILDSVDLRTQRETFSESESSFDISELPQEEKPKKRLEYLRKELRAERISYEELAELQSLVEHIDPSDVELLEAAGVEEHESETPLFTALKNSEVAFINKTYLFLAGEDASRIYRDEGIEAVLKVKDTVGYELITFDPATETPRDLLSKADGWWGFVELTPEEFDKL